ncbi:asparaginase [Priestia megaterium]
MVAGTGGFCTELIKNTNGKLIGKLGADGVYCLAVKGMDIGIAMKIEDGNYTRAIPPVVIRCLEDLGVLSSSEIEALSSFRSGSITNSLNNIVGEVNAVFHLDKVEIACTEV